MLLGAGATPASSMDVITVTDPRHPLCGRPMPLLATHESPFETWFDVEQAPGVRRRLPASVTDRNSLAQPTSLSPLHWDSVRQLLATYTARSKSSTKTRRCRGAAADFSAR